jgi:hypothetical protein
LQWWKHQQQAAQTAAMRLWMSQRQQRQAGQQQMLQLQLRQHQRMELSLAKVHSVTGCFCVVVKKQFAG